MGISRYHSFGRREEGGKGKKKQHGGTEKNKNRVSARNVTGWLGGSSWSQRRRKVGTWPQLTHRKDPLLALFWKKNSACCSGMGLGWFETKPKLEDEGSGKGVSRVGVGCLKAVYNLLFLRTGGGVWGCLQKGDVAWSCSSVP